MDPNPLRIKLEKGETIYGTMTSGFKISINFIDYGASWM